MTRSLPSSRLHQASCGASGSAKRRKRLRAGSVWQEAGSVFTTELGHPCDPRHALRASRCSGWASPAGLHTLRHSAAMLSMGVPLKVVSEILGHSSTAITGDSYGHVAPDVAADAVKALSEALSG